MFSAIKVKREKVEESSALAAQTQSALEARVSQLKGLSVEASSQAAQLAALHAQLQEVVRKVQEVEGYVHGQGYPVIRGKLH
jgi:methyl-accepting chemotaxis protein